MLYRDACQYAIEPVRQEDLPAVRSLIAAAVRDSVATSEAEAQFLIDDIGDSLDWWRDNSRDGLHLKCSRSGSILGVILIKEFWNLSNLFVAPAHQGEGVGRLLVEQALEACRTRSPRGAVLVNSSTVAAGFYRHLGFSQTGPGKDRPGGCVPFRYEYHVEVPGRPAA